MTKYEKNKVQLPDIDEFASSGNPFLKDIATKASIYNLSVNQVAAAQKAWDRIKADKEAGVVRVDPWEANKKRMPGIDELYIDEITNTFVRDLVEKARRFELSDKQASYVVDYIAKTSERIYFSPEQTHALKIALDSMQRFNDSARNLFWAFDPFRPGEQSFLNKLEYDNLLRICTKYRKHIFKSIFK